MNFLQESSAYTKGSRESASIEILSTAAQLYKKNILKGMQ